MNKEQRVSGADITKPGERELSPHPDAEPVVTSLPELVEDTVGQIRQTGELTVREGEELLNKSLNEVSADDVTPADKGELSAINKEIIKITEEAEKEINEIKDSETELDMKKNAESILEQSMEGREINKERAERAKEMSKMLDRYIDARKEDYLLEALQKQEDKSGKLNQSEKESFFASVHARTERARDFFVSIDAGKRENTPLERMAQAYEFLNRPSSAEQQETFDAAMRAHMQEIVERAFDQHIDNPEQYVSHGFDHSLNVADYARDIIEQNDPIVSSTAEKYGITSGEAKFMLEQVALLHDCGYPHVGNKAKAVHGIAGADLVSSPKMQEMFKGLITSPDAKLNKLNHDLRDSILFHSADKVEKTFGAKIETTQGTFLADSEDIVDVISIFSDPENNPANIPRDVTRIMVTSEDMKKEIEEALMAAAADTQRKTNTVPAAVEVIVVETTLKGRFADLQEEDDRRLGLEFSRVDATESPLHSVIRLADNMDMRNNRFSPTQREAAFREIYQRMGDNGPESVFLQEIIDLSKDLTGQEIRDNMSNLVDQLQVTGIDADGMARIQTKAEAEKFVKQFIVENVFSSSVHVDLADEKKQEIAKIAMSQNHESMRHFGGCESVQNVELTHITKESGIETPVVRITINRTLFEELNQTVVTDKSLDDNGNISSVDIGVGEYQIWRAEEAYRSISVGGSSVEVQVVDEYGEEMNPTYREETVVAFNSLT